MIHNMTNLVLKNPSTIIFKSSAQALGLPALKSWTASVQDSGCSCSGGLLQAEEPC